MVGAPIYAETPHKVLLLLCPKAAAAFEADSVHVFVLDFLPSMVRMGDTSYHSSPGERALLTIRPRKAGLDLRVESSGTPRSCREETHNFVSI